MRNAPAAPKFQAFQFEFARHIRDPKTHARPAGVSARRMKIYNELLYNNLEGFLLGCFPVLHRVLGTRKWAKLVREFFAEHRCQSPYFRQIPDEFVHYVQNERGTRPNDPPFLIELAHYEWIELVLSISTQEVSLVDIDATGDLGSGRPVLNPVLALLQYQYPVQRIGPSYKPRFPPPEPTYLLVFRDLDFSVKFVALNPLSARLVALLQASKPCSGKRLLKKLAQGLKHPVPSAVIRDGLEILCGLRSAGAILGTQRR